MAQRLQFRTNFASEDYDIELHALYNDASPLYTEASVPERSNVPGVYRSILITESFTGYHIVHVLDQTPTVVDNQFVYLTGVADAEHHCNRDLGALQASLGQGSGGTAVVVTVLETDSDPVVSANVWITSDSAGTVIVAGSQITDTAGQITILLDIGTTYYIWVRKVGWESVLGTSFVAATTLSVTSDPLTASAYYSSRLDMDLAYGAGNIDIWADTLSTKTATHINDRVNWANLMAKTWIDARLARGRYEVPFTSPYPTIITLLAGHLAGQLLYDTRRVADSDGSDNIAQQRKDVMLWFTQIQSGQLKLLTSAGTELALESEVSPKIHKVVEPIITRDDLSYPFTLSDS